MFITKAWMILIRVSMMGLTIADAPDPAEAGYQWVTEKAGQFGTAKALEMFADMVERNEKRLEDYAEPNSTLPNSTPPNRTRL